MKLQIKNMLARLANTGWAWSLFRRLRSLERKLNALCTYVERQRAAGVREDLKTAILRDKFPDLVVRNGPFEGLRYPGAAATGSALLPKLAGTYENEIVPFLEAIRDREYTDIIDIGCAEGYYAVGLARLYPDASVHAFDVDAGARRMCEKMAEANGVADRVSVGGFCDPEHLRTMDLGARALIFADCESYEAELFNDQTAPALARHDILIECHDFMRPGLSAGIRAAFEASHDVSEVANVPDFEKAHTVSVPEMEGYGFEIRKFIVEEARGSTQKWMFLRSRAV